MYVYKVQTMTSDTVVRYNLTKPQTARYIRFIPLEFYKFKTMRVNVYVIDQEAPRVTATPSERSIQIRWTMKCIKIGFIVDVTSKTSNVSMGVFEAERVATYNITDLQPYTEYEIRVKGVPYGVWSDSKTVRTNESAPSDPVNVKSSLMPPEGFRGPQLRITWSPPSEKNGVIRKYFLRYFYNDTDDMTTVTKKIPNTVANENLASVIDIKRKGTLLYKLSAFTVKEGPHEKGSFVVPAYAPWAAPSNVSAVLTNTSSIAVSWGPVPAEDKRNCDITTYDVILQQQRCTDTKTHKTGNITHSVSLNERSTVFTDLSLCSLYTISVRGNTMAGPGPFSQSVYVSNAQENSLVTPNDGKEGRSPSTKTTTIGIVIALLLVIILMVALIALISKSRRRSQKSNNYDISIQLGSSDHVTASIGREESISSSSVQSFEDEEAEYLNCMAELNPVLLGVEFVKPDGSIDEYSLKKQFRSIPAFLHFECKEAAKPCNKKKNRYKNTIAYDRSRVILKTESNDSHYANSSVVFRNNQDSNYINASFVQGYNGSPRTYIATQGPLPDTTNDFWRMIWDQNIALIVMLTNLSELGKTKCHQYWPEHSEQYGEITVNNHQTEVFADYVIRKFFVSKTNQPSRQVRHFHFTAWPDKGVPQHASAILAFRRKVREQTSNDVGPTVVHCSAGVGRTGAYVMIDAMLQQANQQQSLDIFNYLQTIRGDRPYMVQTEEQYIFVHLAVYEALSCGNTEIQVENLDSTVSNLSTVDENTQQTGFMQEFQRLKAVTSKDIAITQERRVYLNRKGKPEGEYTNATYVDTYRDRNAYIVTQAPLANTVGDFWRLIMDYDIGTIVMLNNLQEHNQIFHQYWPEQQEMLTCDGIKVKLMKVEYLDEVALRTLKVISSTKSLDVLHLQHTGWDNKRAPSKHQSILNLLNEVEKSQQKIAGRSPVLVHCSNGVGRSGTFCAVASTLERVKQEQVLDVFQTVKSIRACRPGAVETLNQYKFCYTIVQNYLDSFSDYDNFRRK